MKIVHLDRERLEDFQSLYIDFFRELRGNQGWNMHPEIEHMEDARRFFERGDIILLALENDEAIGFIRVSSREGAFWIEEIYVRPEMRGKGAGRELVRRAEEEVLKREISLYLYVLPQDKRAIRFWKKMGYDIINTLELVRDLRPTRRLQRTRTVELLGEKFRMFRWEKEESDQLEERFSRLLEEFYKSGGTREELLELMNEAIERWMENRKT